VFEAPSSFEAVSVDGEAELAIQPAGNTAAVVAFGSLALYSGAQLASAAAEMANVTIREFNLLPAAGGAPFQLQQ
jgi:hypothetical protein